MEHTDPDLPTKWVRFRIIMDNTGNLILKEIGIIDPKGDEMNMSGPRIEYKPVSFEDAKKWLDSQIEKYHSIGYV